MKIDFIPNTLNNNKNKNNKVDKKNLNEGFVSFGNVVSHDTISVKSINTVESFDLKFSNVGRQR